MKLKSNNRTYCFKNKRKKALNLKKRRSRYSSTRVDGRGLEPTTRCCSLSNTSGEFVFRFVFYKVDAEEISSSRLIVAGRRFFWWTKRSGGSALQSGRAL
ncbi:unnamed protein product [Victoria cruziana]